jgi:hypothetical protein
MKGQPAAAFGLEFVPNDRHLLNFAYRTCAELCGRPSVLTSFLWRVVVAVRRHRLFSSRFLLFSIQPRPGTLAERHDSIRRNADPAFASASRPFHQDALHVRGGAEAEVDPRIAGRQITPVRPRAAP